MFIGSRFAPSYLFVERLSHSRINLVVYHSEVPIMIYLVLIYFLTNFNDAGERVELI
jgi:hypothetical protein